MSEKCPWDTRPTTLELMLDSIDQQIDWEHTNKKQAPISWCLIPTKEMFYDLIARVIYLESKQRLQQLRIDKLYD
jgi:hypothetical protein